MTEAGSPAGPALKLNTFIDKTPWFERFKAINIPHFSVFDKWKSQKT